jgi:hypothetical protein
MQAELPVTIQKLLWDADIQSLDLEKHQQLIIERVMNYGTLADWRWIVARYGAGTIRALLKTSDASARSAIRSEVRQLASLILR